MEMQAQLINASYVGSEDEFAHICAHEHSCKSKWYRQGEEKVASLERNVYAFQRS